MIEKIRLQNWQNHVDDTYDLDQTTVIVGDNDAGKTSIIRALCWVCFNEWEGEAGSHVTHGKSWSRVTVWADGHRIVRHKGTKRGSNWYKLDGKKMLAGKTVPEEVAAILNVRRDNFQKQGDPPFWLSLTAGGAASALNEVFALSAVDDALSAVAGELRKARTREQVCLERLEAARKERDALGWTKEADRELREIEGLLEEARSARQNEDAARLDEAALRDACRTRDHADALLRLAEEAIASGESAEEIRAQATLAQRLEQLLMDLDEQKKGLFFAEERLKKALSGRCPLCNRGEDKC